MADSSFDIVSEVDHQEADNALNQAAKELSQRFDFKKYRHHDRMEGETDVELTSSTEDRVVAALEVFKEKVIKRGISLKAFTAGDPRQSGKLYKLQRILQQWD